MYWPKHPDRLNRGASWGEITLDFVAATNVRILSGNHTALTPFSFTKDKFADISRSIHEKVPRGIFPCSLAKVTSLGPLGIKNGLEGIKVAPTFMSQVIWFPVLADLLPSDPAPPSGWYSQAVSSFPSPQERPYAPLRDAFNRSLRG